MSETETPIEDLLYRYNSILPKYVELAKELAQKLEQFGKYKEELQFLVLEFEKRKINTTNSDNLVNTITEELQKREIK